MKAGKTQRRKAPATQSEELNFAPSRLGDLALYSTSPIGAKDNSPGQRPGNPPNQNPSSPERAEKTELPEGWRWAALSDVVVKAKQTNPLAEPEREFTYVDVSSISRDALTITQTSRILGKDAPSRAKKLIRAGDVIFATVRPSLRRVAAVPPELDGQVCSTAFCVIRADSQRADPGFLFFATAFEDFVKRVSEHERGSSYPAVTDGQIFAERISVPPLPEQRAIAGVLRTVQGAKEACERVLAATRQLKQSLLHHLFIYGSVSFPHADQVPLKETEIGPMPEHWSVGKLGELAVIVMGSSPSGETYNSEGRGLPLINGPAEYGPRHPITVKWTTAPTRVCKVGDIIFCVRGNTTGRMNEADQELCIGRGVAAISQASGKSDGGFLRFLMEREAPAILQRATAGGSTFPNINKPEMLTWQIPAPPLSEQREIAQQLAAVDAKLAALASRRAALAALFTSLLHHLMTGKVRVNDPQTRR